MSLEQDIRGALTARALTASGLPAMHAYEGVPFSPVLQTPYVAFALIPTQERPSSLGPGGLTLKQGLFQISLFYPAGSGTGAAESAADAVKAAFTPGLSLTQNSNFVRIKYRERAPAKISADWIMVAVTVAWDTHVPTS